MLRIKILFSIVGFAILFGCSNAQKTPSIVGKWEEYKTERQNGVDTLSDGTKLIPFSRFEFTETKYDCGMNDPVNYIIKDSLIYMKGTAWYKIEKVAMDELVLLEVLDCTPDMCYRMYFKRVKKFK
jgi:hypothetical protein